MTDLHDLLDQRARRGSVHPSIEGVRHAVDRRRAHRRRQRTIGSGVAAVCVLAAVAVGVALSSGHDTTELPVTTDVLPEVPTVGLDIEGFEQNEPRIGEFAPGDEPPRSVAVFRSNGSITDPFATVSVQPPVDGEPAEPLAPNTDLDGDGRPDAAGYWSDSGYHLWWRLDDGSLVMFEHKIADSLPEHWSIGYARQIYGPTVDLETIPAPEGLSEREIVSLPDPRGPIQAEVTYEADGGARQVTVTTTNQPGWLDLVQGGAPYPSADLVEEVALGPSFLGSGHAVFLPTDYASGINDYDAYALVETDSGLTLEITTFGVGPDVLTDLIQDGAFVDASAAEARSTTTTAPVDPDSDSGMGGSGTGEGRLTRISVEPGSSVDRVVLHFEDGIPAYEVTTSGGPTPPGEGTCVPPGDPASTYLLVRLEIPSTDDPALPPAPEEGYGALNPEVDGVVQGAYLPCSWFEGVVWVNIGLDRAAANFTAQELTDPFRLVIEVPR